MANTFELIASNTLLSSAASVTFSAIPSTYKDLVLKTSTRLTGTTGTTVTLQLNSDTTANKTYTRIYGDGTTAAAQSSSSQTTFFVAYQNSSSTTANTFTSAEVYLGNYAATRNKMASSFSAQENNSTTAYIYSSSNYWPVTTVISGLTISSAGTFEVGSSFFLYGIKNS